MTDLALEYTGGINAPTPDVTGLAAIVDPTGRNLAYDRAVAPIGKDPLGRAYTIPDRHEFAPAVYRIDTTDATATPVCVLAVPLNTTVEFRIAYLARTDADVLTLRWLRYEVINLDGVITGLGAVVDEQTAVDPTGIVGITFPLIVNGLTVTVAGKAATPLHWTISVRVISQTRINR